MHGVHFAIDIFNNRLHCVVNAIFSVGRSPVLLLCLHIVMFADY